MPEAPPVTTQVLPTIAKPIGYTRDQRIAGHGINTKLAAYAECDDFVGGSASSHVKGISEEKGRGWNENGGI
jgi:hypothetical protein